MQDLTWIKTIFEQYKHSLKFYVDNGLCELHEFKHKTKAADELLENIKTFIREANALVEQQKD